MLNSLIKYEQIITTLPKAKELKPKIDKPKKTETKDKKKEAQLEPKVVSK